MNFRNRVNILKTGEEIPHIWTTKWMKSIQFQSRHHLLVGSKTNQEIINIPTRYLKCRVKLSLPLFLIMSKNHKEKLKPLKSANQLTPFLIYRIHISINLNNMVKCQNSRNLTKWAELNQNYKLIHRIITTTQKTKTLKIQIKLIFRRREVIPTNMKMNILKMGMTLIMRTEEGST